MSQFHCELQNKRTFFCWTFLGHRIEQIPEVPLVVSDKVEELKKTKEAVGVLRKLNVYPDIEKVCAHLYVS